MRPESVFLLKFLSSQDKIFYIPPYQRNYEWTEEQCSVLFEDIVKVYNDHKSGKNAGHFFGSFVINVEPFSNQPDKVTLIDGQQRITTTMIFLIALRDFLGDSDDHNRLKATIDRKYLKNEDYGNDLEDRIKLKQVETDWETYRNLITGRFSEINKDSNIYKNYIFFKKKIHDINSSASSIVEELIENGLMKFEIVTITLETASKPWEEPQEIFESLNSLGKPLTLSDLVRNYLLLGKTINRQEILYRDYWLILERNLPEMLSNYIRDFMQMISSRSILKATDKNTKSLYLSFKDIAKNYENGEIIFDLTKFSKYYRYVLFGGHPNVDIDHNLSLIRRISISSFHPFLMLLLSKNEDKLIEDTDTIDILKVILNWIIRRRIIDLSKGENKDLPRLCDKIDEIIGSSNIKNKMIDILSRFGYNSRFPNNVEVSEVLKKKNFYSWDHKVVVLSMIEEHITKGRLNLDDKHLQCEHIFPLSYNENGWTDDLTSSELDEIDSKINTIGNITLIRHNQEISNKSFAFKKKFYEDRAGIQIAKNKIIDNEKWGIKEIDERTNWIVEYLLTKVIPIPADFVNAQNYNTGIIKKPSMSFSKFGLIGKEISFYSAPNVKARIIDDRTVEYNGERYYLSNLAEKLDKEVNKKEPKVSYRGTSFFTYNGKLLSDIYDETDIEELEDDEYEEDEE